MVYISVTSTKVKGWTNYPTFAYHAYSSFVQAKAAPGNLHIRTNKSGGEERTLTVWESKTSMKDFYIHGAHLQAVKVARRTCLWVKVVGYEADSIPTWDQAIAKLEADGRLVFQHCSKEESKTKAVTGRFVLPQITLVMILITLGAVLSFSWEWASP